MTTAAAAIHNNPLIKSVRLKGHTAPVLCLDHSSSLNGSYSSISSCSLLSGAQDGTARLWDLRIARAVLCIKAEGPDVMSVSFGPPSSDSVPNNSAGSDDNPTSTTSNNPSIHSSAYACDYAVYLSVGNTLYAYDLRHATSPVISSRTYQYCDTIFVANDEINQLSLLQQESSTSFKSRFSGLHVAAADDAGMVQVVTDYDFEWNCSSTQSQSQSQSSRLQRQPCTFIHSAADHSALVTSCAFRPGHRRKTAHLVSGGTDCRICYWEIGTHGSYNTTTKPSSNNKRLLSALTLQTLNDDDTNNNNNNNQKTTTPTYNNNPPMINSLCWSLTGTLLAAALGDGSCAICTVENNRSLALAARLEHAHSGPVACVVFPEWKNSNSNSDAMCHNNNNNNDNDRLLCTMGNDGAIVLWDLGQFLAGESATNPALYLPTVPQKQQLSSIESQMDDLDFLEQPKTLFGWNHGIKPNYVTSSRGGDSQFPSSLFVADTSNDITAYIVPLR
jgi:hypothetical protein